MLFARFLAENDLLRASRRLSGQPGRLQGRCRDLRSAGPQRLGSGRPLRSAMLPNVFRPTARPLRCSCRWKPSRRSKPCSPSYPPPSSRPTTAWAGATSSGRREEGSSAAADEAGRHQDRRRRTAGGDPALHRAVHGRLPAPQLAGRLVAWPPRRQALPVAMPYLRTMDDGAPAAGNFPAWPASLAEFKLLDPCFGSGHFLVSALHYLVPLRCASEGLSRRCCGRPRFKRQLARPRTRCPLRRDRRLRAGPGRLALSGRARQPHRLPPAAAPQHRLRRRRAAQQESRLAQARRGRRTARSAAWPRSTPYSRKPRNSVA